MDLGNALDMASRIINASLRDQAPVKTGALRDSIEVRAIQNGDSIEFVSSYLTYGIYVDLGTGPYAVDEVGDNPWNPKPGKGEGGIIPRFWTSLDESVRINVVEIVIQEIEKQILFNLTRTIKTNE